jgi:hypothetical protein
MTTQTRPIFAKTTVAKTIGTSAVGSNNRTAGSGQAEDQAIMQIVRNMAQLGLPVGQWNQKSETLLVGR